MYFIVKVMSQIRRKSKERVRVCDFEQVKKGKSKSIPLILFSLIFERLLLMFCIKGMSNCPLFILSLVCLFIFFGHWEERLNFKSHNIYSSAHSNTPLICGACGTHYAIPLSFLWLNVHYFYINFYNNQRLDDF